MTTSDTNAEKSDNTKSTVSRRSYLAAIATGTFITTTDTTTATSHSVDPENLLFTRSQLPEAFTAVSRTDPDSGFDAVRSPTEGITSRDQIAMNSFWAGDDPDEPLWVAGSSACVAVSPDDVPRATEMMSQEYAEFIDAYDAETDSYWHFDSEYGEFETFREWRTGIYIGLDISSEELFEIADEPKLIDVFRMQYVNNTLLGTVLFGPTDWYWSYTELLDRLTEYQRKQALSLIDEHISSGGDV